MGKKTHGFLQHFDGTDGDITMVCSRFSFANHLRQDRSEMLSTYEHDFGAVPQGTLSEQLGDAQVTMGFQSLSHGFYHQLIHSMETMT